MRSEIVVAILLCLHVANVRANVADSSSIDTTVYLPRTAFTYAGDLRYTPFGGTPRKETEIQPIPTIALGTVYAAMAIGLHINQANAWWKEDRGPFHFQEDWPYALQVDKLGHIYASYTMSTFLGDLFMECGIDHEASTIMGGVFGLAYETYVEVEDGFATKWGFSPSDAISNAVGSGFYVAQHYVPVLENFTPRWSFVPSRWTGDNELNARPTTFIDDYTSTTFWLACDVERLLPSSAAAYWPDWMMLSVGYGVRDYDHVTTEGVHLDPTPRFMVGLDYNWVRILPTSDFGVLNYLRQFLNYVKLPAPTLEFTPTGTRFHLLYPFRINIEGIRF